MRLTINKQNWLILNTQEDIEAINGECGCGEIINRLIVNRELMKLFKTQYLDLWMTLFPITIKFEII